MGSTSHAGKSRNRSTSLQKRQHRNRSNTRPNNNNSHDAKSHIDQTARSNPQLPYIASLQQSMGDYPEYRSNTKYPHLPAALSMPRIPPTQPRRLAELPNTSLSGNTNNFNGSTLRSPLMGSSGEMQDASHCLSASRRLHLPPEAVVVMLTSPTGSVTSFPNNAYFSLSSESPFMEPVPHQQQQQQQQQQPNLGSPIFVQQQPDGSLTYVGHQQQQQQYAQPTFFPSPPPQPMHPHIHNSNNNNNMSPQSLPMTSPRSASLSLSNPTNPVFTLLGHEPFDDDDMDEEENVRMGDEAASQVRTTPGRRTKISKATKSTSKSKNENNTNATPQQHQQHQRDKKSLSPSYQSLAKSRNNTEAFDGASMPETRIQTRQGKGSVESMGDHSTDSSDEGGVSGAAHPHHKNKNNNNSYNNSHSNNSARTSTRLSDLSDAPVKVGLSSSVKILREFLQQHPPEKSTDVQSEDGRVHRDRIHFSEAEKKEIERLITDLQVFVAPSSEGDENSNSDLAEVVIARPQEKQQQQQQRQPALPGLKKGGTMSPTELPRPLPPANNASTHVAAAAAAATRVTPLPTTAKPEVEKAATELNIKQNNNDNNNTKAAAAAAAGPTTTTPAREAIPELQMLKAKPMPALKMPMDRSDTTMTTSSSSPGASASAVVRKVSLDKFDTHLSNERGTVEGRYREALKTIEDAASDCKLALQRVQDYSESLYILVQTWMHLHDHRFDEFARAVLQRLLDNNPSYRVLFYHVNVQRQSLIIMDMVGRAVVAFTRPADLMDIMGEVGARHNLYGLQESHFISMRKAFLEVFSEFVGPETFNESVGVWKMFWKTTIELAVSGSTTERGKVYSKRRYKIWAQRVNKAMKELIPLQCSGGFHRLMHVTYTNAVAKYPELKKYHQLGDLRTAHRAMEALIRITKRVVHADNAPVIGYSDQFCVEHIFTDLTEPITVDDLKLVEDSFLEACESYMSAANWDEVVRLSVQELWSQFVIGYWTAQPEQPMVGGNTQTSAPDGKKPFCLMFTDIEASTRLWDSETRTMGNAISHHHQVIRGLIEDFGGYEVKTVGDSFLIATTDMTQALLIAFGIQLELMTGPSAAGFHMVNNTQGAGDASSWRDDALRVRVGIHYCTDASAVYDSVHNRFDYYGPSVNCAARIEAAACGGQVLLSQEALTKLQGEELFDRQPVSSLFVDLTNKFKHAQEARGVEVMDDRLTCMSAAMQQSQRGTDAGDKTDTSHGVKDVPTLSALMHLEDAGCHALKGIAEPVQLYSLLPAGLEGRDFQPKRDTVQSVMISNSSEEFAPWIEAETSPSSTTNNDTLTFSGCSFQVSSSPLMRPGEKKPQPAAS